MVASRRPLKRSRLCSLSAAGLGRPRRCCATAIKMIASRRTLQRSRLCSLSAAGLGRPASLLRDGHYNGRVSAAVTTVSPMQPCLHVVGLGRSTTWASIERARQNVPASRADGELHHQGWAVCGVVSPHERTKTVPSEPPNSNAEVNMLPKERARQSVPASRAAGALHQSGQAVCGDASQHTKKKRCPRSHQS
jgi:hypothetical protein